MSMIKMHFLKLKNVDLLTFTQKLAILIDSSLFLVFAITLSNYINNPTFLLQLSLSFNTSNGYIFLRCVLRC